MTTATDTATSTMAALISSYADNKGALGRRYGEWAVSAPTVEAAVAAAAMAQDELGHARSTYPVLDKLGHPRAEAWAKRICRAGGTDLELLLRRIDESWGQAARWPGPDDDAGYRDAVAAGMLAYGPAEVRRQVRVWLEDLLAKERCAAQLAEPTDWSGWDEKRRA